MCNVVVYCVVWQFLELMFVPNMGMNMVREDTSGTDEKRYQRLLQSLNNFY